MISKLVGAAALVVAVHADVYMHNPRGSNNRLDEARRDRNNGNRVFDSQNNNRGGSNVGSLYYFQEEFLAMEWTNQHGCGQTTNDCQMVIQYMCDDRLRDGVTTRTIPQTPSQCLNNDCNTDVRYGMHEDYDYYMNCKYRFRNRGLFNADRNLNGNTARFTRQNNNGNRNGYECPEERDNYPYWHPTPWIDLAVYTTSENAEDFANRCKIYTEESENVKGRHFCKLPDSWYHHMIRNGGNGNNGFIPNTKLLCEGVDGSGGLNSETSRMMQYIAQQDAPTTAALQAKINQETTACNNFMEQISDICTNNTVGCPQYETFFNRDNQPIENRNYVLASDLDAACPVCADPALPVPHPFSSCTRCGPLSCAAAFTAYVQDENNNTVCPPNFVPDTLSETCVMPQCANAFSTLTIDQINTNEQCRGDVVSSKFLVEPTSPGSTFKQCAVRQIASTSCRLQGNRASWQQAPAHNVAHPTATAPECKSALWSRANHLGNGMGGQQVGHNFSIPSHIHERCAIRLRYNITTHDYSVNGQMLNPHYSINGTEISSTLVDSTYNKRGGNNPAKIELNSKANVPTIASDMPYENVEGFLWKNNPKVSIFNFDEMVMYCHKEVGDNLNRNTVVDVQPRDQVRNGDRTWCYPKTNTTNFRYRPSKAFCPSIGSSAPAGSIDTVRFLANGALDKTGTGGANCNDNVVCTNPGATPARSCAPISNNGNNGINNNGLRRQGGNDNNNDNSVDKDFRLQLAINTNQFGRTFQDRTFSYAVREQTAVERECNKIHALNVRGKRGNIVQTFPGTEYDFTPNELHVETGECIHFQWTGSNTNPNNNDGQGKRGTDRSNIAVLEGRRGEGRGGRGVSRYGGKGKDGTFWTTDRMEPGYEGYLESKMNAQPDMYDVQCDSPANKAQGIAWAIPYGGWKYCSNKNPNLPTVSPIFRGLVNDSLCPATDYTPFTPTGATGPVVCIRSNETDSITTVARALTTTWTGHGEDVRDPASLGLNLDETKIGTPESIKIGTYGNSHPEHLDNVTAANVLDLSFERLEYLATLSNVQFRGEQSELDDAGTYFDMGVQLVNTIGRITYLCTRNNNFSNRSQKGKIVADHSSMSTMNCGAEECTISTDGAALKIPENQSVGAVSMGQIRASEDRGANSQSASDVVYMWGNLNRQMMPETNQMNVVSGPGRRDRRQSEMSGLWMELTVPEPLNVPGDNYSITLRLKSPDTKVLWMQSESLDSEHKYVCVDLKWDDQTVSSHLLLTTWNDLKWSWMIPFNLRQSLSDAYEANNVWLDVSFPLNTDDVYNCSGDKYRGQQTVDPSSDVSFDITIPTLAVWKIGNVEHFQGRLAKECMENGNKEACNSMKAEVVSNANCDGESCTVKCTKKCGGYYRVQAEDTVPMIIGITLAVLILAGGLVGSAFYFRRNPEKWESFKSYGPNKYKALKLSMKDRI